MQVPDVINDVECACCTAVVTRRACPVLLQVDGQNVAVEVDGSHHYTNSVPHMPLSEVVVRRRMLQVRTRSHRLVLLPCVVPDCSC